MGESDGFECLGCTDIKLLIGHNLVTGMLMSMDRERLRACKTCGLIQHVPEIGPGSCLRCARCQTRIVHGRDPGRGLRAAAALSLAALVLYPLAVTLPIMRVQRLGHSHEANILNGIVDLFNEGSLAVAVIVLVCSVVAPLCKLGGMFVLTFGEAVLHAQARARTYHLLEMLGRWGMTDVLLVAVLVATVKLGDLVQVHAGPGAVAFAAVVVLSMLASAVFDPESIWELEPAQGVHHES